MSEMEQLKKGADEAYRKQRYDELNEYLELLMKNVGTAIKDSTRASVVHGTTCLAWVLSSFTGLAWAHLLGWFAFLASMLYMHWYDRRLARAAGEFDGAIRVCQILKLIDDFPDRPRKRRPLQEMVDKVKSWVIEKQKAREEAYKPA